ncbi:MAG: SIMPL domain-containing protein [Acidobacteria bacterium]|nr:SIMPL domain-containing protein [Acidobacteriota bacterium]
MRTLALAVLIGTAAAPIAIAGQTIQVNKDNRTIAITATDTAEAIADQAVVTVGFLDYGTDEASAYANGSRRSNAIIAALEKAGFAKNTIESMDQQLRPLNEYEIKNLKAEQKNYRYVISQSWTVKTEPEKANKVLDIAVKAGANQSGNIAWEMKDRDALEAQAAEKAIAHAQRIAAQMAAGLKIHLGPLVYASNQQETPVRPVPMMARSMAFKTTDANTEPLAITSRHITQSATVYAVFAVTE